MRRLYLKQTSIHRKQAARLKSSSRKPSCKVQRETNDERSCRSSKTPYCVPGFRWLSSTSLLSIPQDQYVRKDADARSIRPMAERSLFRTLLLRTFNALQVAEDCRSTS